VISAVWIARVMPPSLVMMPPRKRDCTSFDTYKRIAEYPAAITKARQTRKRAC
jgi:hypothetical protein